MLRTLVILFLMAGSASASDRAQRTRDARVVPPVAAPTVGLPATRAPVALEPLEPLELLEPLEPLTSPTDAEFVPSVSLSTLAPTLAPLEATQTLEPAPFVLQGGKRVTVTVDHRCTRAEARERVILLLSEWLRRFGVKSEWRGDRVFLSGRVHGVDIKVLFDVTDRAVVAHASDPGALLRGSAEAYVDRKLRKYLNPN